MWIKYNGLNYNILLFEYYNNTKKPEIFLNNQNIINYQSHHQTHHPTYPIYLHDVYYVFLGKYVGL